MNAGELDQPITFREYTTVPDDGGGYSESWGDLANNPMDWAKVEELSRPEKVDAGQLSNLSEYKITLRTRSDITSKMNIIWEGYILEIVSFAPPNPLLETMTLTARLKRGDNEA